MSNGLKVIWNAITGVLVAVVVIIAILLVGVRLIGLDVYMVLSGSMEPVYQTGSIVYVKEVDTFTLEVGDDITFMLNEDTIATHRIIEVIPDPEKPDVVRFRTQGVNNDIADEVPVHYMNVIGKPVFTIPYLGYVANYIQNPPGMYIAIAGGAILILLCFLPDIFTEDENEKEKKAAKKAKKGKKDGEADEEAATDDPKQSVAETAEAENEETTEG